MVQTIQKQRQQKQSILRKALLKISDFNKIAQIEEIARRYLGSNAFDYILTILGIIIASFFAKIYDPKIILIACLGAAIALAISGVSGVFMVERAERKGHLRKLEKQLGMSLKKTDIAKAHKFATFVLSLMNGLSPLLISLAIISPFFLSTNIQLAFYISFAISAAFLFILGAYFGKISKESLIKSGFRMVLVGVICFAVIFLVEKLL